MLPLDLCIELEVSRSFLRLRDRLRGPLFLETTAGHVAAARLTFEGSQIDIGPRDEVDLVVQKRAFTVVKLAL